jgi:iron(III) transport system permease protein
VLFFAVLMIAYLTVVPLAMLVYGSFKSSPPGVAGHFTLDHYTVLFERPEMIRSIRNSLVFGLGASLLAFAGGVYLAGD